jgi:glycosyltransferase involved in cell wall biosynthesis
MKITAITTSRIPSNTANSIQVMKVCQALKQLGNEVMLWVPKFKCATWPELEDKYGISTQFEIEWLEFQKNFKQYDFCWKSVRSGIHWGADVFYTWAMQAAAFSAMRKKPTVMEFHDYPMGLLGPFWFRIFMHAPGKKILLTTTHALANGIQERFQLKIPEEILQIAPNGTDLDRYKVLPCSSEARSQLGIADRFTIVYTGHFYPGRGMELMFGLAQALPQFQFLWIGGQDKDIDPWKKRLKGLGIQNVLITGFINNARLPLYQAAGDILLMPYQREIAGSGGGNIAKVINPMKMFDYLATRRAILASDIQIFHEVLNEQNAVFCPPDDINAWIKTLLDLANNKSRRDLLAQQAGKDAELFTWKNRASQTLAKIHTII